jgi:hypothetical protein
MVVDYRNVAPSSDDPNLELYDTKRPKLLRSNFNVTSASLTIEGISDQTISEDRQC